MRPRKRSMKAERRKQEQEERRMADKKSFPGEWIDIQIGNYDAIHHIGLPCDVIRHMSVSRSR
jgi:hypothetical protein